MRQSWALMLLLGMTPGLLGGASGSETSRDSAIVEGVAEMARQTTIVQWDKEAIYQDLAITTILAIIIIGLVAALTTGIALARSNEPFQLNQIPWPDKTDALFVLTFLLGRVQDDFGCLERMACLEDHKAQDVVTVSRMLLKGAKLMKPMFGYSTTKFEDISYNMQDAVDYRRRGGSCDDKYVCKTMPSL